MRKTILVVDDFISVRNFVCESLERRGYTTIAASNGNEAYKILNERSADIDVVLTDHNMPDGSGYELLQQIKGNPSLSNKPVIFLTTEMSIETMTNAKQAGLFAWIKKPYRAEIFFEQIERAFLSKQSEKPA
jgi:two-component system, chemotaxis family, chemotaxis protein CheY